MSLVTGIMMLFYDFDWINVRFDYNIPERAKLIFSISSYLFILKNLYFFDPEGLTIVFKKETKKLRHFSFGFTAGITTLIFLYIGEIFAGYALLVKFKIDFYLLISVILGAFFVALGEELFFRNFLFKKIHATSGLTTATIISAYIYAQAHFLKLDKTLIEMLLPLTGLFFLGISLAYVCYRYDFWTAVGLHAGWIVPISYSTIDKTFKFFPEFTKITGDYYPIAGYFGLLMALIFLFSLLAMNLIYQTIPQE